MPKTKLNVNLITSELYPDLKDETWEWLMSNSHGYDYQPDGGYAVFRSTKSILMYAQGMDEDIKTLDLSCDWTIIVPYCEIQIFKKDAHD